VSLIGAAGVIRLVVVLTVCVPEEIDRAELASVAGIELVVWDGSGQAPEGVERTRFLLAPYMGSVFEPSAVAALPSLEVIQLLSAGLGAWPDRVPPGVVLCNGRGVHGGSTAELAVAGLLSLLRGLPGFARSQAEGQWQERWTDDLDEAEILLLGAGDINTRVAAGLSAFGARCTFVARTPREGVRSMDDLPALLPAARAVVLALPLTDQTRGLVDARFLAALPDGAIVVNVARGGIVDTEALLAETRSGRLFAFLDVTDPEPLPAGHPLWQVPNVLITPHVGGGTSGWRRRGMRLVTDQLERYLSGAPLQNVITGDY
jgi:phosphoglycerate dehydrogenase-like enzyme